jgi:acyl-CoA hydrolase
MKHTQFYKASKLGDALIFRAIVSRVFNTSLEVYITVEAIYRDDQQTRLINDGFFTFGKY